MRFDRLLLTKRFHRALQRYLTDKPRRRGAVDRVLRGLLTDYTTLQRSPLHNPKHRIFHTRVSRSDRLIDLPVDGRPGDSLLLTLGDHSVNKWAEKYDRDISHEQVVQEITAGPAQPERPSAPDPARVSSPLVGARRDSPWRRQGARPGTYGEYLTENDLRYHGVPVELIPAVLEASSRTPLVEVGLEEPVADALETLYQGRLPSAPIPVPLPAVGRTNEALPSDEVGPAAGLTVLSVEQLSGYLRLPLHKFLSQVSDEQRRLIEREDAGLIIVKGAAGTGKTVVGIRRIEHLLMGAPRSLRILFLCYNRVLRDSAYQMLKDTLGNLPEDLGVTVKTAYQWLSELQSRYLVGPRPNLAGRNEFVSMLQALREDPALPPPTQRVARLENYYILEEFAEVMYGRAVPGEAAYVDPEQTQRLGRGVPLLPDERRYLWRLFKRFEAQAAREGRALWEWLPLHLLQSLQASHPDWPLYDAVVVDEAQDLLPVVFRVLLRVQKGSDRNLMVLGDAAQNVYRSSFRWADTGLRVTGGHVTVLRRCYRTTRAIVKAATPLLAGLRRNLAEDLVEPEAIELEGPPPEVVLADDETAELKEIAERIFTLIQEGTPASAIAVFAQERALLNRAARELKARGIPSEHYEKADGRRSIDIFEPSVKLITTFSAKGIEFPVVFIVGVTERRLPSRDYNPEQLERARRILYTAMMRAAYRLTLSAVRNHASGLLQLIKCP